MDSSCSPWVHAWVSRLARVYAAVLVSALAAFLGCRPQIAGRSTAFPRPGAVTLRYLGTAGWQLSSGDHTLLMDPYLTRIATGTADVAPLLPNEEAVARWTPSSVDAIVVGHSHFDHVLDVPLIARRTGARVLGTPTTAHLLRASGVPESQAIVVHGGEAIDVGAFRIRPVRARHSLNGIPSKEIPADVKLPMLASGYGEGGTLQYGVEAGPVSYTHL